VGTIIGKLLFFRSGRRGGGGGGMVTKFGHAFGVGLRCKKIL
jgi:hypothetical protein